MPRPLCPLRTLIFVAVFSLGSAAAAHAGPLRIIAAANVTVREKPSPQARAVSQLPLGTEVAEAGDADLDKTWVRILTSDGKEGWVLASLTRPLDPNWKGETQERLITERLARKGDGFRASVELVSYIERIADTFSDTDARGKMDLYRLRALQQAVTAIPANGAKREPYASWLSRYSDWVVYSEPGDQWLVANDAIWKVHAIHASTTAADDIAWFPVTAGLPGECEGYLPCYLEARNRLEGEYLRRHPVGVHAAAAVAAISQTVAFLSAPPTANSAYSFDAKQDCKPFTASIDALKSAVADATAAPGREAALTSLTAIRQRCR